MISSLRLIRVFVQTAHTTHTNTKLVYDVSATLEYFNKRTLSTVLMRDNYTYFAATSKKWVSKQVLVSTYRYKTVLGCDPRKKRTTIPNEEEIALKHSTLDSQLKTSAALSLSLSLDVPVYAQSEWNSWFYTDWQPVVRYWIEGRRRVFI